MKASYCAGCRDNIYNCETKKCWNFADANIVWRREIPSNQVPPHWQKARRFPNCYHRPGYFYLEAKK